MRPSHAVVTVAQTACRETVHALYRSIDAGRATDALGLFTEDAVLEAAGLRHEGRGAIGAVLASRQARIERVTRHVLTDVRVSAGEDVATLSATLAVAVLGASSPPDTTSDLAIRLVRSGGSDGEWLICSLRSIRRSS